MGATITRKSTDHKVPVGEALLDATGAPAKDATRLFGWTPEAFPVSHGRAPTAASSGSEPRGLVDLGPAAALRVSGPEREPWIQGVQTADVRAIPVGGAAQTVFLNARGRTLSEGLLWRWPGELFAVVPPGRLELLRSHLDGLLIMENAELAIAEGLHALRLAPGHAQEMLARISPAQKELLGDVQGAATALGFEMLLPEELAQTLLAAIPERPEPVELEAQRVGLGVPAWGVDFDESSTPLEAGLDAQIAFGKGCYVGQEVIAMATYRGRVPWNLVRLEVEGAAPATGSALDTARGGKGKVTSAVQVGPRALLLGIVHREKIEPGAEVLLADGRTATVLGLPFGSRLAAGASR